MGIPGCESGDPAKWAFDSIAEETKGKPWRSRLISYVYPDGFGVPKGYGIARGDSQPVKKVAVMWLIHFVVKCHRVAP